MRVTTFACWLSLSSHKYVGFPKPQGQKRKSALIIMAQSNEDIDSVVIEWRSLLQQHGQAELLSLIRRHAASNDSQLHPRGGKSVVDYDQLAMELLDRISTLCAEYEASDTDPKRKEETASEIDLLLRQLGLRPEGEGRESADEVPSTRRSSLAFALRRPSEPFSLEVSQCTNKSEAETEPFSLEMSQTGCGKSVEIGTVKNERANYTIVVVIALICVMALGLAAALIAVVEHLIHNRMQDSLVIHGEYTIIFGSGFLRVFLFQFHRHVLRTNSPCFRNLSLHMQNELAWLVGRTTIFFFLFPMAIYIYQLYYRAGLASFFQQMGAFGKIIVGFGLMDHALELCFRDESFALRLHHMMEFTLSMLNFEWLLFKDTTVLFLASQDVFARIVIGPITVLCFHLRNKGIHSLPVSDGLAPFVNITNQTLKVHCIVSFVGYTFVVRAATISLTLAAYATKFKSIRLFWKVATPLFLAAFVAVDFPTYLLLGRHCSPSTWRWLRPTHSS
jgi:hypothetical protein